MKFYLDLRTKIHATLPVVFITLDGIIFYKYDSTLQSLYRPRFREKWKAIPYKVMFVVAVPNRNEQNQTSSFVLHNSSSYVVYTTLVY